MTDSSNETISETILYFYIVFIVILNAQSRVGSDSDSSGWINPKIKTTYSNISQSEERRDKKKHFLTIIILQTAVFK